jgi:transposase
VGADAKTDQIDAKVISQFASVLKPIASEAQSDEERSHSASVTRRTQLVDLITQERNRLKQTWGVQKTLKHLKNERVSTRLTRSQRLLIGRVIPQKVVSPQSLHLCHPAPSLESFWAQ